MKRKQCPAFEVDCVINFWDLADYTEMSGEELFYKLWPEGYFEEAAEYGHFALVDIFDKIVYNKDKESSEMWDTVKFYIEDYGYRFYDKVIFIF